ncbi:MAG: bifunctional phosphoglucose/phosphomannose isomerase [Ignavibacteriales bacterium]|nr:bifunctional phosphoglucose/phosphomannose isomerase [Ignavibacteriales bacterium]
MTMEQIKQLDPQGMYQWIRDFPGQVEEAVSIGKKAKIVLNTKSVNRILLTGLGGSAIGGDLLRSYLTNQLKVPFIVNRHYTLPAFVDKNTLVIVSSYSGNTEETIAAHRDAVKRKAKVLCISTNGETAKLAKKFKQPVITIPPGLSPRAALGYSFFPLLIALARLGFIKNQGKEISETIALLQGKAPLYSDVASPENAALKLAEQLQGKLPIIYSPTEHLDTINVRWRGQISENAKQLAYGHVLPEMNHNELVGWKVGADTMKRMHVVFLRDAGTHPRVALREDITKRIVVEYASSVTEIWSEGRFLLARLFSLIYLGDWVSYYLAILNNQDPTPVKAIDYLKNELAKI